MVTESIFYREVGKESSVFEHAFKNKIPLLLKGPTGSGKSRFVEFMAERLNLRLITVNCHEETSATDLIGRFLIKGTETVWMDGPLTMAVKEGYLLYLDEIAEARPDIIVAIHSLTDHRRELFIDKLGQSFKATPNFMLIASFNPGYQRGFKELKPSTRQRFATISFNYPKPEVEAEIITNETGIHANDAEKLVKIAQKIRNLKELGLTETASTRLLVNAATLMHSGLPKRLSLRIAIVEPLSDEPDVVEALSDLCNLYF
ncbi:MAG: CbbQ/NirQ/NorQ/GpvN family protein [Chitinophagales bacterium]|nr:CbbQ/NirQ/NorQ/GpvN family protein [Chitinophagales bacterium]